MRAGSLARTGRLAVSVLAVLVAVGCGKKGDPRPPLRPTPATILGLRVAQRGDQVEIRFTAPRPSGDGARLPVLEIEILEAHEDGEFAKVAHSRRQKAAPGEVIVETAPLPPPGTTIRVAARAIARGRRGSLPEASRLLVTAPLPAPHDLTASLVGDGVALAWQGTVPEPIPTPSPTKTPTPSPKPNLGTAAPSAPTAAGVPPAPEQTPSPAPPAIQPPPQPSEGAPAPERGTPPTPDEPRTPPASPPSANPTSTPTPAPTPEPFNPGFFIYRRPASGAYLLPLLPVTAEYGAEDKTAQPGESWCYVLRSVASADPLVESAASNEACIDVKDVRAPAAPAGVAAIAQDAGIEVSWSPSPEPDLLAYRVYRRPRRGGEMERLAEIPAGETTYVDKTPPDGPLLYSVTAVDKAGNESAPNSVPDGRRP